MSDATHQSDRGAGDAHATRLLAGVAKSEITTDDPQVKVNDPLLAKALVLDDGTTRVAIVTMDAVAIGGIGDISDEFLPELRRRIEGELEIPAANVLVNASHTHPPGRLLCEHEQQVERTLDAIRRAASAMEPVKVGSGVGFENRFIVNRTLIMRDGRHWTVRHANPCPPDDEVADVGPIDPEIGILRIDRTDGRPLAVVYNYACHPYLGVPRGGVTADYPGFASSVIEENWGDGVMAFFLQGAGGDISETLYKDVNRPRDAEPRGVMLGLSTLRALRDIKVGEATLSVSSEIIQLPRRTDIPQRIDALLEEQEALLHSLRGTSLNFKTFLPLYLKHSLWPEYPADDSFRYMQSAKIGANEYQEIDAQNRRNIEKYLKNIAAMERLARIRENIATLKKHQQINDEAGEPTASAEVLGVRIGECVLITAPLEALVEVSLNVKRASPYNHTFMAAFSNGYYHYGPPVANYDKGGYEVTECLLGPEWQECYEEAALRVIRRL